MWNTKQQWRSVPFRLLTSDTWQTKLNNVPALWKISGLAVGLGTIYYSKKSHDESRKANEEARKANEEARKANEEARKANEEAYRKSFAFAKEQVKKKFHLQVPKPLYKLPHLKRNELYSNVLSRCSGRILLIEGASGSGKTKAAQELMYDISTSKQQENRRGVLYFPLRSPVTDSRVFFDEIVKSCYGQDEQIEFSSFSGYDVLRNVCYELCKEDYGNRPILIIDDAQKLAANDSVFVEIMGELRGLMEIDGYDLILIVSNGSILKKSRSCSGLSYDERLAYMKWPHVSDEEMKRYIFENQKEIFKEKTVTEAQVLKFVKLFDSSFIDLNSIAEEKDLDSYMDAKLMKMRQIISSMQRNQKEVLKKVYKAKNHKISLGELGSNLSSVADELVNINFLAHVDEVNYMFHDRLSLEAMAEEMKSSNLFARLWK
jgi:ABC-type microcin C transport system duplicated ATPase subunit YejF